MNFKSKNGITLIALVITIIVLLILAGVSISTLVGDDGIATRAKTAAEKFNHSKAVELETLDELGSYIASESRVPTTMWVGNSVGTQGTLKLPMDLNDCSKEYILTVESTLFKGKVCLKVYGIDGWFFATSGVDSENNYMAELRHIYISNVDELFAEEGIAPISYESNGKEHVITYDAGLLGSELTVTKIQSMDKVYDGYAGIVASILRKEPVTVDEVLKCCKVCLETDELGYNILNEMLNAESEEPIGNVFNEDLERNFIKEVYEERREELNVVENTVLDEVAVLVQVAEIKAAQMIEEFTGLDSSTFEEFTLIDYISENDYLNEFYTRTLGNSVLPFTVIFYEATLKDLNIDGALNENSGFSLYDYAMLEIFPDTGLAGFMYRTYADFYAILGPLMMDPNAQEKLTQLDILELQELYFSMFPMSGNSNDSIYNYYATYAQMIVSVYNARNMDDFYGIIFDNGIKINLSGLRIGWNSMIIPDTYAYSLGIIDDYNFLADTEHIKKQNVESLKDELNAFIVEALKIEVSNGES